MGRNALIGLGLGVIAVGGLGFYVYSQRKAGKSIFGAPPLYSGYGPGPQNPAGPPVGKAGLSGTLQDINNVINGGDKIVLSGKKTWDDVKSLFSNDDDGSYSEDFVNSLPEN